MSLIKMTEEQQVGRNFQNAPYMFDWAGDVNVHAKNS